MKNRSLHCTNLYCEIYIKKKQKISESGALASTIIWFHIDVKTIIIRRMHLMARGIEVRYSLRLKITSERVVFQHVYCINMECNEAIIVELSRGY